MKIGLYCSYSLLNHGGVQEHTKSLGATFDSLGHEVVYISPDQYHDALPPNFISGGISTSFPSPNGSRGSISLATNALSEISNIIANSSVDLLHVQEVLSPLSSWPWIKASTVPVILTCHSSWEKSFQTAFDPFIALVKKQLHQHYCKTITVSRIATRCNKILLKDNSEIPPAFNLSAIRLKKSKPQALTNRRKNVLFVGRLDQRKGIVCLLKALSLMKHSQKDSVLLHIVGDGPHRSLAQRFVTSRNLEQSVIFHGQLDQDQKYAFFQHSDLFVAPATNGESFGMVLIEALAAGCPLIAGNNEGYVNTLRTYPHQEYILNPKNSYVFSEKIEKILNNQKQKQQIVQWAASFVEQFDSKSIAKKHLAIYQKLLTKEYETLKMSAL